MQIGIQGSDGTILTQIPALREGFISLGHNVTTDLTHPNTAFAFIGNPPLDNYLELTKEKKTIFNVLDCPTHVREWPELKERWSKQLIQAHRVTIISKTVARQIEEFFDIKAEVIYYPSKKVHYTGIKKYPQFRAMMVGRLSDPNKRSNLAIAAMIRAGFNEDEVAIVGPEYIGYGTHLGLISDEMLNDLYNSVDYVFMTSLNEGIGLTSIEGAMCGAIPIVCPDLTTFNEFWAGSPLGIHYQTLHSPDRIAELVRAIDSKPEWKQEIKQDMLGYAELAFKPKFSAKNVAARIIDVFHTI